MKRRLMLGGAATFSVAAMLPHMLGPASDALDSVLPMDAATALRDADEHLPDDDSWSDPVSPFQRKALAVLHLIEAETGIPMDWNKVDLASARAHPREFPFRHGTGREALTAYSQWTGLLVTVGPRGKVYVLNPNPVESGRTLHHVVVEASADGGYMSFVPDDDRRLFANVTSAHVERHGVVQLKIGLDWADETDPEEARRFILKLDPGDLIDLSGSTIDGTRLTADVFQQMSTEYHLPAGGRGGGAKTIDLFPALALQDILLQED